MWSTIIAAAFVALAAPVAAQASTTISQSMPPSATAGFDISQVPEKTRFDWCLAQRNNCQSICGGADGTDKKDCFEADLSYVCVCANGTVPDVSAYQETIPFFVCQETFKQCIAANPRDAQGQQGCKDDHQCGDLNATAAEDSSSDSSSTTATPSASAASGSTSESSSASSSPSNAATAVLEQVPSGAFALVFLAAFKFLLL